MAATSDRVPLVFGIVAAVGTPIDRFLDTMQMLLRKFDYDPVPLRLSELLQEHVLEPSNTPVRDEGTRINTLMDAGDRFRERMNRGDAMAMLGVLGIRQRTRELSSSKPLAFLLRQLKRQEEISTLRGVYGDGFFVVSIYSTRSERKKHLTTVYDLSNEEAEKLITRDEEDEYTPHGQKTRDTFELGDFFVRVGDQVPESELREELQRFLDLIFGRPDLSPLRHEHAMYMAYAASLRSADLSRQVGAAIIDKRGTLLAVGANDVPTYGGGQYWPGTLDQRDHRKGFDSNAQVRDDIARDIFDRIAARMQPDYAYESFRQDIASSALFDITEYGRAVHAEMDAILSCARTGVSTVDGTLFSTTFPCHNCAKHIVDAGITEVQYVEAYPKSKAAALHADSIHFEDEAHSRQANKVAFRHFVGLGPRRYLDLCSVTLSSGRTIKRKHALGEWDRARAIPRVPSPLGPSAKEDELINQLTETRSP